MTDEELIAEAKQLPVTYCDGFGAYRKVNGLLRCVGYVIDGGVTLNLACSLPGADLAQAETARVLREKTTKGIVIWDGSELAH